MLQRIRDSLQGQRWLAYLVLGALAVVFAAWGAYGIVNLNFGGSNYAAEANGSKISIEDARNAWVRQQSLWQQRLGGSEMPPPLRTRLQDQVLESLIRRSLLTQRSHDLGYRVSDTALREAVQESPHFRSMASTLPTLPRRRSPRPAFRWTPTRISCAPTCSNCSSRAGSVSRTLSHLPSSHG